MKNMKMSVKILFVLLAVCFSLSLHAQTDTTYNYQVPFNCGTYNSASPYCYNLQVVTPDGNSGVAYYPEYSGRFNSITFLAGPLDNYGKGVVTSVITVTDSKGLSTQTVTFTGTNSDTGNSYTGLSVVQFTVKSSCCSGGKGYHAATTWAIQSGHVTFTE